MSETDAKKWMRKIIATAIGSLVVVVLSGVFTVILSNNMNSKLLKQDVDYLKKDSENHASKNEMRLMFDVASERMNKVEDTNTGLSLKVDRHYEQIMKSLNEIK